jgi:hypothetical protein
MAERRMFAKTIIDSDAFLDMPLSTQALYFHLSMRGDDEGFVNNPKKLARMLGSGDDELKVLIAKKFIILFDSGVIVIKHWKMHNYIRGDRIKETNYADERDMLLTNENGSYTMIDDDVGQMSVNPPSNVSVVEDSIGKVRKGKVSIVDNMCAYEKESDFSLSRDTHYDNLSKEYKEALQVFIESMGLSYPFDDFVNSLQAKASYKYKNFVKTYRTWAKNHIPKQAPQQRMDISKLPEGVSLQDMLNEAGEQWEREQEQKQIGGGR